MDKCPVRIFFTFAILILNHERLKSENISIDLNCIFASNKLSKSSWLFVLLIRKYNSIFFYVVLCNEIHSDFCINSFTFIFFWLPFPHFSFCLSISEVGAHAGIVKLLAAFSEIVLSWQLHIYSNFFIINHIGSSRLCSSSKLISCAENPFFEAVIKWIAIYRYRQFYLKDCNKVPLLKVVLKLHFLYSNCSLFFNK